MEKTGRLHRLKCLSASSLKLFAMAVMLLDHMWGTGVADHEWMTCLGRLAFPIFAFQVAEGYAHTKNFRRYLGRMFLFALLSEAPFNWMNGRGWINPFAQNVMFTFCLALLLIRVIDKARTKNRVLGIAAAVVCAVVGYYAGMLTFVDYYGYGVLMVLAFWLFRDLPWGWLLQLGAMIYINCVMFAGLEYQVVLFGHEFMLPHQGLAVLALIPIWMYNGKQGIRGKAFQYACYAFYPVHMLVLALIASLS